MSSEAGAPPALEMLRVSKRYDLRARQGGLRRGLIDLARGRPGSEADMLWALRDVSFAMGQGEGLGIVGPNGAGKTTALKILSRVTRPTTGEVRVRGRLAALVELGAGFHPELTGRENVYLNASILGLRRSEVRARFDDIIAFSGLERFVDTPVKRYSSGMYVRLGFAVAAHLNPAVLLIDEVIAVGDAAFRMRCLQRIRELRAAGTAVVLVSHNMRQVVDSCDRAVLLAQGSVVQEGSPFEVAQAYERLMLSDPNIGADRAHGPWADTDRGSFVSVSDILVDGGTPGSEPMTPRSALVVSFAYQAPEAIRRPIIRFIFTRDDGVTCLTIDSTDPDIGQDIASLEGRGRLGISLGAIQLVSGRYTVEAQVVDSLDSMLLGGGLSREFVVAGGAVSHRFNGVFQPAHCDWHHVPGADADLGADGPVAGRGATGAVARSLVETP